MGVESQPHYPEHEPQKEVLPKSEEELAEKREQLLEKLPQELRNRWEGAEIEEIEDLIKRREELGYAERITGYHVSNKDLPIGARITPGEEGTVFYSTDLSNLYGRHGGGFIYEVEGTPEDEEVDEELGWRRTKGSVTIVNKYPINPETMKELGASFARVEYH